MKRVAGILHVHNRNHILRHPLDFQSPLQTSLCLLWRAESRPPNRNLG